MEDQQLINMDDEVEKYCVSSVLRRVCEVGLRRLVGAWNNHSIPKKGIPNVLQLIRNGLTPNSPHEVPTLSDAASAYRLQGGRITEPREFGIDPLYEYTDLLQQREQIWLQRCAITSIEDIYGEVMSGNIIKLQDAILSFINLTMELDEQKQNL